METRLTTEESAKLIELGVSPERASNMWVKSSSRSYTCEKNSVLKFIRNELLLIFALMVFIGLVAVLGTVAIILLSMLGCWIGIGKDIFIYLAACYIFWKVWDALAWIVGKIADRIERKKEREYFERLYKKQ